MGKIKWLEEKITTGEKALSPRLMMIRLYEELPCDLPE